MDIKLFFPLFRFLFLSDVSSCANLFQWNGTQNEQNIYWNIGFHHVFKKYKKKAQQHTHIFDVRAGGEGGHNSWWRCVMEKQSSEIFMKKAFPFLLTHTFVFRRQPWRDRGQCHRHKKRRKGKIQIWKKICVTLKFMAEQYYFVCMCLFILLSEMDAWTRKRRRC